MPFFIKTEKALLTFAPLCEHHFPHSTQEHVELPVAQLHAAADSVPDKHTQWCQPVSVRLWASSLVLAEGHHDLAERDVQSQRLHIGSWDNSLLVPGRQCSSIGYNWTMSSAAVWQACLRIHITATKS